MFGESEVPEEKLDKCFPFTQFHIQGYLETNLRLSVQCQQRQRKTMYEIYLWLIINTPE